MKKTIFTLLLLVGLATTVYAAPYFRQEQGLVPVNDSTFYLGTTTPALSAWLQVIADSFYDTNASDGCASWSSNVLTSTGVACGAGGGSGGGTWSTTTSQTSGVLVNYPNNTTDLVAIGSNSSTTAEFYFDPNIIDAFLTNFRATKSTTSQATTTNFHISSLFNFGGDVFDELVGTGLQVTNGDLQTTLGTSIDIASESNLAVTYPITLTGSTVGFGGLATTSTWTAGQLAYVVNGNTVTGVATGTVSGTNGITVTSNRSVVGGALAIDCTAATGSATGCLQSADWTVFNNKISSTSIDTSAELFALLTDETGGTGVVVGSVSPAFTGTPTFQGLISQASSTVLYLTSVNSTSTSATTTNLSIGGNLTFNSVTGNSWDDFCTTITGGAGLCDGVDDTGAGGSGTVSTSTNESAGQLSYWTTNSGTPAKLGQVATTSLTANSPLSLSQPISVIGGSASALSLSTTGDWTGTLDNFEGLTLFNGRVSTSAVPTIGQIPYWTGNGTPSTLGSVATGTVSGTNGVTVTSNRYAIGGALAIDCTVATASAAGCLATADWTKFNEKISSTSIDTLAELETLMSGINIIAATEIDTSSEFFGILTDETGGSGVVVGSVSPAFTGTPTFQGFLSQASSTAIYFTSINSTSTSATTTNLSIGGNLTFNSVTSNTWAGFCTTITGGAGLCDGSDDGGAGTSAFEIATTSDIAVPNLAYFTKTSGRTTLGSVATGTVSGTNGITVTSNRYAVGGALAIDCAVATASAAGCLATADWTKFNDKISSTSLSAVAPISYTSATGVITTTPGSFQGNGNYLFPTLQNVGIGTSTPVWSLQVASSTKSQLTISDGSSTSDHWSFRNAGGVFYLATSSPSTFATSSTVAFSIDSTNKVTFGNSNATCIGLTGSSALCDGDDASGAGGSFSFTTGTYDGQTVNATSTGIRFLGSPLSVIASSSFIGNATTTNATTTNLSISGQLDVDNLTSALTLTGSDGVFAEYAGTSCTNQFVRSLSALGVATCATVGTADVSGLDISDDTNLAATWPVILTGDTLSFGGLSTTSPWTNGQLAYVNSGNTLTSVATGTVSGTNGITVTSNRYAVGGALAIDCTVATASAAGCLATADWTKFNNKISSSSLSGTAPISYTSGTGVITTQPGTFAGSGNYIFSTNQRVGIGTTTPQWSLQVASSTGPQLALSDGSLTSDHWTLRNAGGNLYFATSSPSTFATTSTSALELRGTGKPGIAVSSSTPTATLTVEGRAGDFSNLIYFGSSTPHMRINNSGNIFAHSLSTATNDNALCIDATTKEIEDSGGATCALSSLKAKENIEEIRNALEKVISLHPVSYTYKENGEKRYGFIAEEVIGVDPLLVEYAQKDITLFDGEIIKQGEPRSVDYLRFTAYLTKAVQEIWHWVSDKVANHESRIEKLEKENVELRTRLEALENK